MVTRQQIQKETGISYSVFVFYRRLDLIPGPIKIIKFNGKGSVAYYDDRIIKDIKTIQYLQKQGWTLKQIRSLLLKKEQKANFHISKALEMIVEEVEKKLEAQTLRIVSRKVTVNRQKGEATIQLELETAAK